MNPTAEQIQKINHFSKVTLGLCEKIASAVKIIECGPKEKLLNEGDTGDTMILVFQGQVEVSKDMMVKTPSGFATSRKPIIRLETTDPKPASKPITDSTAYVVESPAFFKLLGMFLCRGFGHAFVQSVLDIRLYWGY